MNEKDRDRALHIKTNSVGEKLDQSSHYHHYEATAYWMLDELFNQYSLEKTDVLEPAHDQVVDAAVVVAHLVDRVALGARRDDRVVVGDLERR